jgi:hypothetical protein
MKVKILIHALILCALFPTAVVVQAESDMVFEMRTYTTYDGKLDNLHQRFANHTMTLFERHGMRNIGYWVPSDPKISENTLVYIIAHTSQEAAEQNWKSFVNDPEWQKVYEASIEDGKLVRHIESVFLTAADYSQIR